MPTKHFITLIFIIFFSSLDLQLICQNKVQNTSNFKEKIDEIYLKKMKKNKVVGASMAIIDNGEIVYESGLGFEDKIQAIQASPETVYNSGSVTKSFTALAVMQLHEKGLLDINHSIKKYIPELTISGLKKDGNEICIKDILAHTSGLPSDLLNGIIGKNVPEMDWAVKELNKQYTISPKQQIMAYSNIGYGLLGQLIERVSGMSYSEYMAQNIFEPLQMEKASVGVNDKNISKAYVGKKEVISESIRDVGAGSINCSARDLIKFVEMLMENGKFNNQQILNENLIAEMEKNYLSNNALQTQSRYGFGIESYKISLQDETTKKTYFVYTHTGDEIAFHAGYAYIPELKIGAVFLTNTDSGVRIRSLRRLLTTYFETAKGMTLELEKEIVPQNETALLSEIPGSYNLGPFFLEVTDPNVIKTKMGPAKIVFKRVNDENEYSIKILLLGLLPIKDKTTLMKFVKVNGEIYCQQVDKETGSRSYLGKKTDKIDMSQTWINAIGQYKAINAFETEVELFNFTNADSKIEVLEDRGWPVLKLNTPGMEFKFYLNIISDHLAQSGGVGRQANNTIRILENGNVYFSGLELKKIEK